ncbi:nuclease-related domain-containing protein [Micromonospora aurantiaca]|uniref:nuclease-related domain-containing protein n=1 Tax=Micromonospora aurantiaca (nom. illeg.) TaxID=47850 RepID=UPI0037AAE45C
MTRAAPTTRYRDFIAAARRHTPSALLPTLAAVSASQFDGGAYERRPGEVIFPWMIAAAARENIAFSNEHRSTAPVTQKDLGRLRDLYINLEEPFLDSVGQPDALESFLVRTAFEQFPYQHSRYEDMSRILLLFDRDYTGLGCRVLSSAAWTGLLGLPVDAFMRTAFFIMVGARVNGGWFDPRWLDQPHLQPALNALDVTGPQVMDIFRRIFGTDVETVRRRVLEERKNDSRLHRYEFNPLVDKPFVLMPDNRYLAPNVYFVAQRLSPAALYYVGWNSLGKAFADDLGVVTEVYVGEQLALVNAAAILHDVEYAKGQHAADYIVVLPGLTLVIEVKSARVSPPGRLDQQGYLDDLNRDVGKALKQIKRTGDMIRNGHPAFTAVDPTQEIRGIVVTAEPHYLLNSQIYRDGIFDPEYQAVILSLGELEHAVAAAHAGDSIGLFTALTTPRAEGGYNVEKAISTHERSLGVTKARNPLLDDAYKRAWGPLDAAALKTRP